MLELTLEDLASPEAMEIAEKKILLDMVNESVKIAELDRQAVNRLAQLQADHITHCARKHEYKDSSPSVEID